MSQNERPRGLPAAHPRPVLGTGLRRLLWILGLAIAALAANSLYLIAVRIAGAIAGRSVETPFSLGMFLLHVLLGLGLAVPFVVFVILHGSRGLRWPNRRAAAI